MPKLSVFSFAVFLAASASAQNGERIAWQHPSLELYRGGISDYRDRVRIELCVQTKEGSQAGTASVGYPRYRTSWGQWRDGVLVGSHSLNASADTNPACFAVLVPPNAAELELPLDDETLRIPVAGWLNARGTAPVPEPEPMRQPERETEPGPVTQVDVDDPWAKESAPVVAVPTVAPPAPPVSDVDGELAASVSARPSALAVVLGVGTYAKAPVATFAAADATTAARYFEKVLGIPASRIELLRDNEVTLGQMQRVFGSEGWLARRVSPESEIFIFFAGHGTAEPEKFSPYLLPADADPDYLRQTGISLDKLIGMITSLGAKSTTLFLDACFSGLTREGISLQHNARPLLIEKAPRVPSGLSVYSAGSGSQIVSALEEQGHGIFSYYLFKGIAGDADLDHDHHVLASELKAYLENNVPRAAQSLDREQTPGIVLSDPEEVLVQLP